MNYLNVDKEVINDEQKTVGGVLAENTDNKNLKIKKKKMKLSKRQECLTAYHEAGHAVANYLFGKELSYVTIIPNFEAGEWGRTQPVRKSFCPALDFGMTFSIEGRAEFERAVIVSLAGHITEIKFRFRRSRFLTFANFLRRDDVVKLYSDGFPIDDNDFYCVRACFDGYTLLNNSEYLLGKEEREAYFQYLWLRTINMMTTKQCWNAVTAVAEALLKKKRLGGKETKKIIAKKIPFRHFVSFFHLAGEQLQNLLDEDCMRQQLGAAVSHSQ